ncbi:hypothetical protein WMW71_12860 [Flavobacterium buctense]|uniref:Uncharacterized protein n=2 Tax=Flavobacterium buctense TaxID=1648146 RepID=A0ABU9E5E1_9FLAO
MFSQEIHSTYKYKKVKDKVKVSTNLKWDFYELDSLVLFKNKTFYHKKVYHFHEFKYSESKGDWKISNDTLYLNVSEKKFDDKWENVQDVETLTLKKKKLIPIKGRYYDRRKKLKLES